MKILGNIIWHVPFLGFITAFLTFFIGVILLISILGIPLGLGLINLSKFLLAPFSYEMVNKSDVEYLNDSTVLKIFKVLLIIIYLPVGILLSLILIIQIVLLFFTIVGIPAAAALAKALPTFFNPVDKKCISGSPY